MGNGDRDVADQITRQLVQRLPDGVKRRLAGPYNIVQARRADRTFRKRTYPSIPPAADAPKHVVCVVVDALRADVVDSTTPTLESHHGGDVLTASPWTFPAVTSIVTGRYPHEHGAMRQTDDSTRQATDLMLPPALPEMELTLPEVYASAGYDTYGGFAFHMPFFALSGRFATHSLYDDAAAETVISDYLEWLENAEERTFSYLHLADLHEPVDPPALYWDRHVVDDSIDGIRRWDFECEADPGPDGERYREHRRRLYRAGVDYVDDQLQPLFDAMGPREDVVVIVTGDHGEGLWEWTAFDADRFTDSRPAHGIDHGGTPYESLVRVPLIASGLPIESTRNASLIDLAPTLLTELGHPDALDTSGYVLTEPIPDDRIRLVEASRYGHEKKATYLKEWKLLVSESDGQEVGFSLPEEEVTTLPLEIEEQLVDALPPWPDGAQAEQRVSGMARDRLEELGYV